MNLIKAVEVARDEAERRMANGYMLIAWRTGSKPYFIPVPLGRNTVPRYPKKQLLTLLEAACRGKPDTTVYVCVVDMENEPAKAAIVQAVSAALVEQ